MAETAEIKVAYNQATAKSTEKHNDRSMYRAGYENRGQNIHWDCYGIGSSYKAEARFYQEMFGDTLEAQNEKAREMSKYDRLMTMDEWHEKHMPKESIISIGRMENRVAGEVDFLKEACEIQRKQIEECGGHVISWDLHQDEVGVAHLHTRYVFTVKDKNGNNKVDMKNCLKQHGVERPDPTKRESKTNSPSVYFIESMREKLDNAGDKYIDGGVNRIRRQRKHESVSEFKTRKAREEREAKLAQLDDEIESKQATMKALEQARNEQQDEREKALDLKSAKLDQREQKIKEAEAAYQELEDVQTEATEAVNYCFDLVDEATGQRSKRKGLSFVSLVRSLVNKLTKWAESLKLRQAEIIEREARVAEREKAIEVREKEAAKPERRPEPQTPKFDRVAAAEEMLGRVMPKGTMDGEDFTRW